MASTDFLLQPSTVNNRTQSIEPNKTANERADARAPAQSFSSLYAQQRATAANQQQQRDSVRQEKQQQAARQTAAKNTAVAHANKDKAAAPSKARAEVKAEKPKDSASHTSVAANPTAAETPVTSDGKALPPETVETTDELANPLIDPLLLMALAAQPSEPEVVEQVLEGEGAEGPELAMALLTTDEADSAAETKVMTDWLKQEDQFKQQNTVQLSETSGNTEADAEVLIGSATLKTGERVDEKSTLDKNLLAATTETNKAAPETLLTKAVSATEAVRSDLQARPEPTLANQALRQVPGPAVAMQQPGWSQQVTDKVMWMSSQNLQSAEIKLDPAELGRLDVKISVNQEHSQITFNSAHAGVRDSLESQMFRLREMFAQQGMQNVDVNVADHSHAQQDQREQAAAGRGQATGDSDNADEALQHTSIIREQHDGRLGMVDYYA